MKRLITVNEVKQKYDEKCDVILVDKDTLITPAAIDLAMELSIEFKKEKKEVTMENVVKDQVKSEGLNFTEDLIQKIVQEVLKKIQPKAAETLIKECDSSGIRLVRGDSVVCEEFNTGNPSDKVGIKEILNIKECPNMATGFMTIDHSEFDYTLTYDELDYIVEGTMDITINGKNYIGKQGDVFYIPKDTSITFGSKDSCKFFFSTYPANWAELSGYKKK